MLFSCYHLRSLKSSMETLAMSPSNSPAASIGSSEESKSSSTMESADLETASMKRNASHHLFTDLLCCQCV